MRRFLCSRNPHFGKWSFDGRSRNHRTDPHEMGEGSERSMRTVGIIPATQVKRMVVER